MFAGAHMEGDLNFDLLQKRPLMTAMPGQIQPYSLIVHFHRPARRVQVFQIGPLQNGCMPVVERILERKKTNEC